MGDNNNGGPAFPVTPLYEYHEQYGTECQTDMGMSLRDYFAGQVLAGIMSQVTVPLPDKAAGCAYLWADAMMEARKDNPCDSSQ